MNRLYYDINGERYPRVSSILGVINKPALNIWRAKLGLVEADRISREATEFGTRVHAACEQVAQVYPLVLVPDLDGDARLMLDGFADWLRANVRRVIACERVVISHRHRYAGTADLIAVLGDGSRAVLDYKTSKSLSDEYAAQLAAYRLALREERQRIDRRLVVHLLKDQPGVVQTAEYPLHKDDERAFLSALALYRWLEATRRRRNGYHPKEYH